MPHRHMDNRGRRYVKIEIIALADIELVFGSIHYVNNYDLEREFYERTGVWREGATLYMADQRRLEGKYDRLLAS